MNLLPLAVILSVVRVNPERSRQTRKIGPALARMRLHWPNIVPYTGIHWVNFSDLWSYNMRETVLHDVVT